MIAPIRIAAASVHHLRAPITTPVKTSFGVMKERTAVCVAFEDAAGRRGWGESWVNFPAWASWERTKGFETAYLPWVAGKEVADIPAFIRQMYQAFLGPATQAGSIGPLIQALCAVELALWNLAAQAADLPLRKLWAPVAGSAEAYDSVPVYGSGINAPLPFDRIDGLLDCGVGLFKLKLGFGDEQDLQNLKDLSRHLGAKARLAVDVNRAWDLPSAKRWLPVLRDFGVQWLEEPLRPDQKHLTSELQEQNLVPIAGGENRQWGPLRISPAPSEGPAGNEAPNPRTFSFLDIVQPDITKNCLPHQALAMLPAVRASGRKLYPHFLGSAVGQAASLQLAALCGPTLMEWDVNENPLHTDLLAEPFRIENGRIRLSDAPGLGWTIDAAKLDEFRAW